MGVVALRVGLFAALSAVSYRQRARPLCQKEGTPMQGNAIAQFLPLVLIFAIMYFLLIRPQQKKLKDHKKMVEGVRRGDQVITQGGIIGKVSKVREDGEIEVEIAENVKVRVLKSTLANVISKTEPAAAESK
jgi:preprotein translocase subunit YajC